MYIKHLIIENDSSLIRKLDFYPGMNLIVDDTQENTEMSGNNVGKTTVLRLIEYCLGGDEKPIYTASDGRQNTTVKDFLTETNASVELCLVSTFVENKGHKIVLKRNFLKGKKALNQVNGKNFPRGEYEDAVQSAMWGVVTGTPRFRDIISHSIRIDHKKHEQPLLTIGKGNDAVYETLYLYLFGLYEEFCASKQALRQKISHEQNFMKRLEKESAPLGTLRRKLRSVEAAISSLEEKKKNLVVNPDFESDLEKQVLVKKALRQLAMKQNSLELRKNLVEEVVREMKSQKLQTQANEVRMIYEQANIFGAELHHTFEELVKFHTDMLMEKSNFISSELPTLDREIEKCYAEIDEVRKEEDALDKKLKLSVTFETYEKIHSDMYERIQEKGQLEANIAQIEKSEKLLCATEQELKAIDDVLFTPEYTKRIDDRLDEFNAFFSAVSRKIYNKDFAIQQEIISKGGKPCYRFSIEDNGNYSEGVKKGEATCFDLAYVNFADEKQIPCLHFVLNDKEEKLHDNQLLRIAAVVEEQKNIQYISSILSKKLPEGIDVKRYTVLSLSEKDKLFGI